MNLSKIILTVALTALASMAIAEDSPYFLSKLNDPDNYNISELEASLESICRIDDLQHIESYDGRYGNWGYGFDYVQQLGVSVGAIKRTANNNSRSYCSGTLIGVNQFLTASHCVDNSSIGDIVSFGFQDDAATGATRGGQLFFNIAAIIEDGADFGLDYALLRLNGTPGSTIANFPGADGSPLGWKTVNGNNGNLPANIIMIQHPLGDEKQVDAGSAVTYSSGRIRYADLDTQPGSSGSGILNSQGQVIGVHTNGGCRTSGTGSNSGVFMQDILVVSNVITEAPANSLTVLSNDHSWGQAGQYFNFDLIYANTLLGRTLENGETLVISNLRTGETAAAIFWTSSNGGSIGDGHGRWVSGAAGDQWQVGDTILFTEKPSGFSVLSNDHSFGGAGHYFNFDIASANSILGRGIESGERLSIANLRTGEVATAVLWTNSNGGSIGDGHGRWDFGAAPSQWQVGDTILFTKTTNGFTVLSNDHEFGEQGHYFNFDIAAVNSILGRNFVSNERISVKNIRTGKVATAVLWTNSNGGSIGDGHGRWDSGASPGQWQVGDILQF